MRHVFGRLPIIKMVSVLKLTLLTTAPQPRVLENMAEISHPKQQVKKLVAKNLEKRLVVEKVWSAQNESEALNLLRYFTLLLLATR